jgi:hypothetical protein
MRRSRDARPRGLWAHLLSYRPSPSMIVALIALFVAMSGTTYAVKRLSLPKRVVGSAQIKSKAIRTYHIKARNVRRTKISRSAIDSSLVQNDSLRGSDILEASLGNVPSASKAANADRVGGLSVQKFSFRVAAGTASTNVLSVGGLVLNASCSAGLTVSASTTASAAHIHSGGTWGAANQSFYVEDDAFDVGNAFDPLENGTTGSTNLNGTLVYARQDGGVVTVDFLADESPPGCVFAGTAIG